MSSLWDEERSDLLVNAKEEMKEIEEEEEEEEEEEQEELDIWNMR